MFSPLTDLAATFVIGSRGDAVAANRKEQWHADPKPPERRIADVPRRWRGRGARKTLFPSDARSLSGSHAPPESRANDSECWTKRQVEEETLINWLSFLIGPRSAGCATVSAHRIRSAYSESCPAPVILYAVFPAYAPGPESDYSPNSNSALPAATKITWRPSTVNEIGGA